MLKAETALRVRMLADAGIQALVESRIYPLRAPAEAVWPLCCYARAGTTPEYNMSGPSDFTKATIRLTWWSRDYDQLDALARAGEKALIPDEGTISVSHGSDEITFDYLRLANQWEDVDEVTNSTGTVLYGVHQEFNAAWEIPAGE